MKQRIIRTQNLRTFAAVRTSTDSHAHLRGIALFNEGRFFEAHEGLIADVAGELKKAISEVEPGLPRPTIRYVKNPVL